MFTHKAIADKIMVLGVDGLDPRYSKKCLAEGKMPNFQKLIDAGACREDLVLLGAQPPVTPPQWCTLSTGAYPSTHGIVQFFGINEETLDQQIYNLDSRRVLAEQSWNCFAEAGKKTLVMHWPGGAWPPTSDSENLYVIDGTIPGAPGMTAYMTDQDFFFGANTEVQTATFIPAAATDGAAPCVIDELPEDITTKGGGVASGAGDRKLRLVMDDHDGFAVGAGRYQQFLNVAKSPIKDATGWDNAPADAKEMTILTCKALIRRPALILKNEEGKYDSVAIYKSKKAAEPMAVIKVGEVYRDFVDEGFKGDNKVVCGRDIFLLECAEDGTNVRMYFSTAAQIDSDAVVHPAWLHKELMENVGPWAPTCQFYSQKEEMQDIMLKCWDHVGEWYYKAMSYMIEKEGIEVIYSHWHAVDLQAHTIIRYLKNLGHNEVSEDVIEGYMDAIYEQCDRYIGQFLHYLDEGWTIIVTSDHGLVGSENEPPMYGDMCGCNVGLMEELGYTVLKRDENGNKLKEIDWSKTRAIADQGNQIWLNVKGRNTYGIVEPEDKYELEEQIMTDLLSYKDKKTGKRVFALALRNKDAMLLGYGGSRAGDIYTANAEGYNFDHTDGLSTTYGVRNTSLSPIFFAAGKGIKKGYKTDRVIRQVDVAPTMCALAGVRLPKHCEGIPAYDILDVQE